MERTPGSIIILRGKKIIIISGKKIIIISEQ